MSKDQHRHHNLRSFLLHHRRSILLIRAAGFALLFSLGYALGFLSVPGRPPSSAAPRALASSSYLRLYSIDGAAGSSPPNPSSLNPGASSPPARTTTTTTPAAPDFFRVGKQCAPPLPEEKILPTLLDRLFNGTSPFDGFPPPRSSVRTASAGGACPTPPKKDLFRDMSDVNGDVVLTSSGPERR